MAPGSNHFNPTCRKLTQAANANASAVLNVVAEDDAGRWDRSTAGGWEPRLHRAGGRLSGNFAGTFSQFANWFALV